MRNLLIAGAALSLAVPAFALAQDGDEAPPPAAYEDEAGYDASPEYRDDEDYAGEVEYGPGDAPFAPPVLHPGEVADVAQRMDRLVGAVMNLPIGPIVAAVDPEGRSEYGPGATVRDVTTAGDPEAEARIRGSIHAGTAGIGAMSEAFARMAPVLQRSMEDIQRSMDAAMGPYRGD